MGSVATCHLATTACLTGVAGQLQLLLYVPFNLAASPGTSRAQFMSWLLSGPKLWSPTFSMSNPNQSLCVVHPHPGWGPSRADAHLIPAGRATSLDCREPATPLLWVAIYCFSMCAAWYGCFCLLSSLLLSGGISPQEKGERNRNSSKAGEWQERISD